ncbi:neuromedin-U receptor 2 [Nematostella vectensis]|uniref:neuromedin-U receptor 2 n=1 Tax=Nematostella vectensis TaxID=45351 RepID=UPI002077497B|nr:neuromedin-U receptor 2 [Nematostella vectensis]
MDESTANSTSNASCSLLPSPYLVEHPALAATRLSVEAGAAIVGVLGNILVCVLATRMRILGPSDGLYIRSLAISDLGILLVNFPIAVIKEQSPLNWPIGRVMCYVLYPVSEMFHGACIWSIVAIAIERYRIIVHNTHPSLTATKLTILSIWLGAFALFVVPLLFIVCYEVHPCGTLCLFKWPNMMHNSYIVLDICLLYLLPLMAILFTYARITRELNKSTTLHRHLASVLEARKDEELERVRQNARTKQLLTALVWVFTITMLPLNLFRLVFICWKDFSKHRLFLVFYNVSVLGVVVSSAADPIIYSIITRAFIASLMCKWKKRNDGEEKMVESKL